MFEPNNVIIEKITNFNFFYIYNHQHEHVLQFWG